MVTGAGNRQVALGAICWIATLQYFVVQAVAQRAWTAPYSLIHNYISDLGNTTCEQLKFGTYSQYVCSPLHGLMNASFIALGVLTISGAILTRGVWSWERLVWLNMVFWLSVWLGVSFLVFSGAGKIVVGLVPENVNGMLHNIGADSIPAGNLALLLLGIGLWLTQRRVALSALALGAVGGVGFVLYKYDQGLTSTVGLWERVADYPLMLWMAGMGLSLTARTRLRCRRA